MANAKKHKIKKLGPLKESVLKRDVTIDTGTDVDLVVELTDQQMLFCQQYLALNLNGKQAAIAAGYAKVSAHVNASRLLMNDNVRQYIAVLKNNLGMRIGITADKIALEFAKIGFADIRRLYYPDGTMKAIADLPDDVAASVSTIEIEELYIGQGETRRLAGFTKRLRMHDKVKSLESLAKMIGVDGVLKVAATDTQGAQLVPYSDKQTERLIEELRKMKKDD